MRQIKVVSIFCSPTNTSVPGGSPVFFVVFFKNLAIITVDEFEDFQCHLTSDASPAEGKE